MGFIYAIFTRYVCLRYRWNITLKKCQSFQVNERETLKEVSFWENPSWQPFQSNIPLRSIIIPQTKSILRKLTPQGISLNFGLKTIKKANSNQSYFWFWMYEAKQLNPTLWILWQIAYIFAWSLTIIFRPIIIVILTLIPPQTICGILDSNAFESCETGKAACRLV